MSVINKGFLNSFLKNVKNEFQILLNDFEYHTRPKPLDQNVRYHPGHHNTAHHCAPECDRENCKKPTLDVCNHATKSLEDDEENQDGDSDENESVPPQLLSAVPSSLKSNVCSSSYPDAKKADDYAFIRRNETIFLKEKVEALRKPPPNPPPLPFLQRDEEPFGRKKPITESHVSKKEREKKDKQFLNAKKDVKRRILSKKMNKKYDAVNETANNTEPKLKPKDGALSRKRKEKRKKTHKMQTDPKKTETFEEKVDEETRVDSPLLKQEDVTKPKLAEESVTETIIDGGENKPGKTQKPKKKLVLRRLSKAQIEEIGEIVGDETILESNVVEEKETENDVKVSAELVKLSPENCADKELQKSSKDEANISAKSIESEQIDANANSTETVDRKPTKKQKKKAKPPVQSKETRSRKPSVSKELKPPRAQSMVIYETIGTLNEQVECDMRPMFMKQEKPRVKKKNHCKSTNNKEFRESISDRKMATLTEKVVQRESRGCDTAEGGSTSANGNTRTYQDFVAEWNAPQSLFSILAEKKMAESYAQDPPHHCANKSTNAVDESQNAILPRSPPNPYPLDDVIRGQDPGDHSDRYPVFAVGVKGGDEQEEDESDNCKCIPLPEAEVVKCAGNCRCGCVCGCGCGCQCENKCRKRNGKVVSRGYTTEVQSHLTEIIMKLGAITSYSKTKLVTGHGDFHKACRCCDCCEEEKGSILTVKDGSVVSVSTAKSMVSEQCQRCERSGFCAECCTCASRPLRKPMKPFYNSKYGWIDPMLAEPDRSYNYTNFCSQPSCQNSHKFGVGADVACYTDECHLFPDGVSQIDVLPGVTLHKNRL